LAAVINIVLGLVFIGIGAASPDLRVFLFIGPFLLLIGLGVAFWALRALRLMEVGKTFALKLDPANPEHPLLTIA
jgi:uncharacterized membrane protein YwzB